MIESLKVYSNSEKKSGFLATSKKNGGNHEQD
nr:MAG TPA: hypothetical protein [Caudoviricetes sp.]